ncbi:helix-turn-helix transcriptional regulator, partial [Listeria welshimeri]|nr:helix-turn-helix transcriptional regulator [Listeria welshimeri]
VQEEYHLALSLKEIAGRIHMNTMYLGQLFKKETNKSFSQYLHQYRIKQAQSFLVDTAMTISEVAERTGYTSAGYFYKSFKKICGISPKEFREEYQANFDPIE